jgi:hypothetical protein
MTYRNNRFLRRQHTAMDLLAMLANLPVNICSVTQHCAITPALYDQPRFSASDRIFNG